MSEPPARQLAPDQPEASQAAAAEGLPEIWGPPSTAQEHPKGDEIRRQVEFYFSDQNLPTDRHLLEKCQGRLNVPVSIKSICGFKKMRQYRPFTQVVQSLKQSAFLDVVEGNRIKRKVPFIGKTVLDEDDNDSDANVESDREPNCPKPAAKNGKKTQQKKEKPYGWDKPHGFEEFFADAPVTPAEFKEEGSMYDPGISFRLRMEVAIQRYKSRRTMHQHFLNVFSKFMKYGGVDQTQRQFTGGIKDAELEERDAQDIALMMASHTIDPDKDDEDKWPVDFEAVAKGFLSSSWPTLVFYDIADIRLASTVLKNFYNYLLYHNVCPEHNNGIYAARRVCELTEIEFPKVTATASKLPGDFNVACSTLFDGFYKDKYTRIGDWDELESEEQRGRFSTHTKEKSGIILKAAIGAHGTEEHMEALETGFNTISCTGTADGIGLEVTGVEMPSAEVLEIYATINTQMKGRFALEPLGKLYCRPWDIPDFGTYDLPAWRLRELEKEKADKRYEFWVEANILESCFVGMKMQACVRTLSLGIMCLDQIQEVYCSFYSYLPNELMWRWKEPNLAVNTTEEEPEQEAGDDDDSDAE
ncbi:RNA-binding protein Lupus La [Neofusicoccum parvum]|nr:RNA-binding protein Lupus La [Neofusicoccum parvum]